MEKTFVGTDLLEFLRVEGTRFLDEDACNRMGEAWGDERMWEAPLLGAAHGADPIFETFKDTVDPRHWTPVEAFAAGGLEARAEELSIVSWILPHNSLTIKDNAQQKDMPAERWARSRIFGEPANEKLRAHMTKLLKNVGIDAVAPMSLPSFSWLHSARFGHVSHWSERHIAYACGLGTFGLCEGLITPVGKAVRIGSVVLRGQVNPTPRPYTRYDEYCLLKVKKTCGACIKRCPVGALSEQGHDKPLCDVYLKKDSAQYVQEHYGFKGFGCGLCQTGVPCSSGIPEGLSKS